MSASIVVSLEGPLARIVYGSVKGGSVTVKDVFVMPVEQLEDFLDKERASEFTIVNHFSAPFQEIISVPSVKKRLLRKIVEIEIRKRTGFDDFSYIHSVIGDKTTDQGKRTDVFVFAVRNDDMDAVIGMFSAKGKTVKAVYPDVFVLARGIAIEGEDILCVSTTGPNKVFSLVRDGKLQFTRDVLSNSTELNALDIQNMDMTVNYCRQTLRVLPSGIMLTGRLGKGDSAAAIRGIPMACFRPEVVSKISHETLLDFVAPALALKPSSAFDISPADYVADKLKTRLLKYSSLSFLVLTIFLMAMSYATLKDARAAKQSLHESLGELPDIDSVVSSYEARKVEFERYAPFMDILKRAADAPDLRHIMYALSALHTERITFNVINMVPADGALRLRLEGSIRSSSYASTQSYFEKFIASFSGFKGANVVERRLMIKDKSFLVEVEYR